MSEEWELPGGWEWAEFRDVAEVVSRLVDPSDHQDAPHIAPNHIESGTGRLLGYTTIANDKMTSSKHRFYPGQILYSKIRPYLCKAVMVDFGGLCSADMYPVSARIDTGYLHKWMITSTFTEWASQQQGRTVLPKINQEALALLKVPVAPLEEQRRIVAKMDALRSCSRKTREALEATPPLLEQFCQSILASAFRGDLTADWRERHANIEPASVLLNRIRHERRSRWEEANPQQKYVEPEGPDLSYGFAELPDDWTICSVGDVSECLDRLRRPITRADRNAGSYPYYGANGQVDSVADYIFDDELVLITEDETFYGRRKPIAYRVSGKCWVNNHAHVLRAVEPVTPDYLWMALMHYNVLPWLSGTTARAKLTQGSLNVLPIALPPLPELEHLTVRLRDLLAWTERVQDATNPGHFDFAILDQSILAQAFRGELVPQDPNDEPASVLLERIRAERENGQPVKSEKAARGRRK
jgi:type I restriction enzyme, S subunit